MQEKTVVIFGRTNLGDSKATKCPNSYFFDLCEMLLEVMELRRMNRLRNYLG